MYFSIVIVRSLVETLERRGVATPPFCASVGITREMLDDPTHRVDRDHYVRIVDRALAVTAEPRLGLHVGSHAPVSGMHILGYLVSACPTMRDSVRIFDRYSSLVLSSAQFSLEEKDGIAHFSYEPSPLPDRLLPYDTEFCFAMTHRIARLITPTGTAREVSFRHDAPSSTSEYTKLFGCPVRFGMEKNTIAFDAHWLDVPNHHGDPALYNLLRTRAEAMLNELAAPSTLPARIRDLLRRAESPAGVDATDIAEKLGLTERTLRRHLQQQGHTFRDLSDATLREMACMALQDPHAQVKEVAMQLGFSEPSAFYRAFKRWTGLTPVEYRASQGATSRTPRSGSARMVRNPQHGDQLD